MTAQTDVATVAQGERDTGLDRVDTEAYVPRIAVMTWEAGAGWGPLTTRPFGPMMLHPAMACLHYGQGAIEGLKAHRQPDGTLAVFRPWAHARRLRASARRMCMPELPEAGFVAAVDKVVTADQSVLPDDSEASLYLRPVMFASEPNIVPRPARQYTFLVLGLHIGRFFGEVESLSVWISRDQPRAFPGGTGSAKVPGNYAPTLVAQDRAVRAGCQQVLWLDAIEHKWVEEMGSANLFFVRGEGAHAEIVTPPLADTFLPGVTRDSVVTLARRLGYPVQQRPMSVDEWRDGCVSGEITETFGCGTAAVVSGVGVVKDEMGSWRVGDGRPGPVTRRIRQALVDLYHGRIEDTEGWLHRPPVAEREQP